MQYNGSQTVLDIRDDLGATYKTKDFYMGRTLDYEFSYGEQITITPRNYEFDFQDKKPLCFDRNGICCRRLSASVQGRSQMAE